MLLALTPILYATSEIPSVAEVLSAVEDLMAFRLRAKGFSSNAGGRRTAHFTGETMPTFERASDVAERQAASVRRNFDVGASERADLVEIAALRAAIELELSVDNYDRDRVRDWREQLREYVTLATPAGDAADTTPGGASALKPVWGFGPGVDERAEGSEIRQELSPRRLRW